MTDQNANNPQNAPENAQEATRQAATTANRGWAELLDAEKNRLVRHFLRSKQTVKPVQKKGANAAKAPIRNPGRTEAENISELAKAFIASRNRGVKMTAGQTQAILGNPDEMIQDVERRIARALKQEKLITQSLQEDVRDAFNRTYDLSRLGAARLDAGIALACSRDVAEKILSSGDSLRSLAVAYGILDEASARLLIPKYESIGLRMNGISTRTIETMRESDRVEIINLLGGKATFDGESWEVLKRAIPLEDERKNLLRKLLSNRVYLRGLKDKKLVSDEWISQTIETEIRRRGWEGSVEKNDLEDDLDKIAVNMDAAIDGIEENGKTVDDLMIDLSVQNRVSAAIRSAEETQEHDSFAASVRRTFTRLKESSATKDCEIDQSPFESIQFLKEKKPLHLKITVQAKQPDGSIVTKTEYLNVTAENARIRVNVSGIINTYSWETFDGIFLSGMLSASEEGASVKASFQEFEDRETANQGNMTPERRAFIDEIQMRSQELIAEEIEREKEKEELRRSTFAANVADPNGERDRELSRDIRLRVQKLERSCENGNVSEVIAGLSEILSGNDFIGTATKLSVGTTTVELGKPGKGSKSYNLFTFAGIDLRRRTVLLDDGRPNGEPESIPFLQFLSGFKQETDNFGAVSSSAKIIPDITDAKGFLANIQGADSKIYGNLRIDGEKLVDEYRKHEEGYAGTSHFIGNEGRLLKIHSLGNGKAKVSLYKEFKEESANGVFEATTVYHEEEISYAHLTFLFHKYGMKNRGDNKALNSLDNNKNSAIAEKHKHLHTEHGGIKHLFARASVNDLLHGLKGFTDFLKHKFEHGNHLQEARIMLALGKKLGMDKWNNDWFLDLKGKVENDEKKLVEDRVEELGKMASPDRQDSIRESLLNDGTHDYEHWANALSMLEKHGTLYAGKLKDLEGTYVYLKRIAGVPLSTKIESIPWYGTNTVAKLIEELKKNNEPVTEEAIIREYCKKNTSVNSLIWRLVKGRWEKGFDEERTNGKKEADAFMTLDRRKSYSLEKLHDGEYYHAIGAALSLGAKGSLPGPAADKHTPWFVMAVSNMPSKLHQNARKSFAEYYKEGRSHSPALMFMESESRQEEFRQTVLAFARHADRKASGTDEDGPITREFLAVIDRVHKEAAGGEKFDKGGNVNLIHNDILNFWKRHSATLQPLLTGTNPEFIAETAKEMSMKGYFEVTKGGIGDMNLEDTEMDNGTYLGYGDTGASIAFVHPGRVLGKIKINASTGSISGGDTVSRLMFGHFVDGVKAIRDIQPTAKEWDLAHDDEAKKALKARYEAKQKAAYERLHRAFFVWATDAFGGNYEKIMSDGVVNSLKELGFYSIRQPKIPIEGKKEGRTANITIAEMANESMYQNQLEHDFHHFLNGMDAKPSPEIETLGRSIRSRIEAAVRRNL